MVQDVEATSDYSSVLANLQSNTEYEVKMRPYFNELQGHDSITLLMRTPEEGKETRLFSLFNFKKLVFIYNCALDTFTKYGGVDPYECRGFLNCLGPWRVVDLVDPLWLTHYCEDSVL